MVNAKYDLSHAFHTQIHPSKVHPYKILQKKSYTNHSFEKEHTQMILKEKNGAITGNFLFFKSLKIKFYHIY